jgi:hypothetical protein
VVSLQHFSSAVRPYWRQVGREPTTGSLGEAFVQSAQPRDFAALAFVVSIFVVLLVVSLMVGSPAR